MVAPAPPSPLDFHPDDALAHRIVADLAQPQATLASVAEAHNIPLATLALWLSTPRAAALFHTLESGACRHVRLTASLHLSTAVQTLLLVLDNFKRLHATLEPTDPILLRAAALARIAAYHLYRLSRITPLTDEQIARAAVPGGTALQSSGSAARAAAIRASLSSGATPLERMGSAATPAAPATMQPDRQERRSPAADAPPPSAPSPLRPSAPSGPFAPSPPRSSAHPVFTSPSRPSRSSRSTPSPRRPADLIRAAAAPIPLGSSP
ncbi:MAG: hypothetical protein KF912_06225 [Phycisphaeraceae bacterium]|nr:hypothetical protein [Phycisphaeraceae bacterium]